MQILPLMVASALAASGGQLLLKAGAAKSGRAVAGNGADLAGWFQLLTEPLVFGGIAMWIASTLTYLLVLSRTQLSFAYGFVSISYLLVPLLSQFVFGERIPTTRWAGMAIILVGVMITVGSRLNEPAP